MKKFLLYLADKPTPQIPDRLLRHVDRYFRKGRHHDAPGTVSGWATRAWLKERLDHWAEVHSHQGIQAAIALGY